MKDIMANGYRAGGNCRFFTKKSDGTFTVDAGKEALQSRLNFEDNDTDEVHPSLLAFPMMEGQAETLHNEISISSRLLPWDVHSKTYNYFPGGFDMYQAYKTLLGLDHIHFGEDLRASENMEYMSQVRASTHTLPESQDNPTFV